MVLCLDEDISKKKPIIKTEKGYLGINAIQNQYGLFIQLEGLIKSRMDHNKRLWKKYEKAKSEYAEDLAYKSFKKLFKRSDSVYRNLKYQYKGRDGEIDIFVKYGNSFVIVEVKSGSLRPNSQSGNMTKLNSDLKKILKDAYSQTQRAIAYISNEDDLVFYKGNEPMRIKKPIGLSVFSICVSVENLMMITQNLKNAKLEGFFEEGEFPWAVNLLELEVILDCIEYPSLLLNYIRARLDAQENDKTIFHALDELSYFGFYLKNGPYGGFDFSNDPNFIYIDSGYLTQFDEHYCQDKQKPIMNLDPRLRVFIEEWEGLNINNKLFSKNLNDQDSHTLPDISEILYYLLKFQDTALKNIFNEIENRIQKTRQDAGHHSLCFGLTDFCLNFHSDVSMENLEKMMFSYAKMKKHQQKHDLLLSLGSCVNIEEPFFINRSIILKYPYK